MGLPSACLAYFGYSAAAAAGEEDHRNDHEPKGVVVKEIAETVVHSVPP